jgi:hypothetical protein
VLQFLDGGLEQSPGHKQPQPGFPQGKPPLPFDVVLAILITLEETVGFLHLARRQVPDPENTGVDALVEPAEIDDAGNVGQPMEPDDGPIPGDFGDLNGLIFIELVIDGLDAFEAVAGIFQGHEDDALDIAQLLPGRGLKADIEGDVFPAANAPGVIKHSDNDVTGNPVVDLHEEFPGVGKGGDFRAQPRQQGVNRLRRLGFEIFDDGPGIEAAVVFVHDQARSLAQAGGRSGLIRARRRAASR